MSQLCEPITWPLPGHWAQQIAIDPVQCLVLSDLRKHEVLVVLFWSRCGCVEKYAFRPSEQARHGRADIYRHSLRPLAVRICSGKLGRLFFWKSASCVICSSPLPIGISSRSCGSCRSPASLVQGGTCRLTRHCSWQRG